MPATFHLHSQCLFFIEWCRYFGDRGSICSCRAAPVNFNVALAKKSAKANCCLFWTIWPQWWLAWIAGKAGAWLAPYTRTTDSDFGFGVWAGCVVSTPIGQERVALCFCDEWASGPRSQPEHVHSIILSLGSGEWFSPVACISSLPTLIYQATTFHDGGPKSRQRSSAIIQFLQGTLRRRWVIPSHLWKGAPRQIAQHTHRTRFHKLRTLNTPTSPIWKRPEVAAFRRSDPVFLERRSSQEHPASSRRPDAVLLGTCR